MITEVITFWGIVQGVGFRPTLSRIAAKHRMRGQVRNMGAFVQLIVTDEPERIDAFIEAVRAGKPRMADIMRIDREVIDTTLFDDFRIVSSAAAEDEIVAVPADIAVCDECLAEFRTVGDPRFRHPFISCTNCGPRYTIMERLPYDRETTAMRDFSLCPFCGGEYTDPVSRRYHAQTVSCHDCGPRALWRPRGGGRPRTALGAETVDATVAAAEDAIKGGGVIALKGVGGYYFACSPYDEAAVRDLRAVKVREYKPFAVMFASVGQVRAYCEVSDEEEALLTSPKRPIVLLEQRAAGRPPEAARAVCAMSPWDIPLPSAVPSRGPAPPFAAGTLSTSRFVGAFLPSMALQYMLVEALGPLIMTSANIAGLPMIRDDDEMFAAAERDARIAGVLYNERRIVRRVDDSVTRVIDGAPQLIRRSKGWTPVPLYLRGADKLSKEDQVFAAGADLKSAFALTKGSFIYMSQYIGDMDRLETERVYEENLASMREFFGIEPGLIACDMHPLYRTSDLARKYVGSASARRPSALSFAGGGEVALLPVQHHHAHIASVMAEHGLAGPVIGVAFDGTGYGTDGTIWGGEILICEGAAFERFSHLRDIEMIGGDASMRDGWKSALCRRADHYFRGEKAEAGASPDIFDIDLSYIVGYAEEHETLAAYEDERKMIEAAVKQGVNTVRTSSMGRLFDAVASLLGVHHVNRYEGECAVMLENAAARALWAQGGSTQKEPSLSCRAADALALRFHLDVAHAVLGECRRARVARVADKVCLSGGVFQNRILMEETLRLLRADGFSPYYNKAVPPNDGGVALGQACVALRRLSDASLRRTW